MTFYKILTGFFLLSNTVFAVIHPDQHYTMRTDDLSNRIESAYHITVSSDGTCIELEEDAKQGYLILLPDSSEHPFNRGLPSWNGTVTDENTSFLIQMRFPYEEGWSDWLTVGYWKDYIWNFYGKTSFPGGFIDIDYVKLNDYTDRWQFRINMIRNTISEPSPTIHKLSFFVSDSRTTDFLDYGSILDDNPEEIFIETDFLYQYGIDDEIGGSICSPTTVSMILHSYYIEVDPYSFAVDTYDPYYGLFGVWPRVVQNASEKGLDGAVTRYRTWSEARDVLADGGRIAMSVGPPLYGGHLMMLAGFTNGGNPIVHDPARSNGYAYIFNKSDLSHSWFDKGGIAYTFFPADSQTDIIEQDILAAYQPEDFQLYQNYPNPFNSRTRIRFELKESSPVRISVYDARGGLVEELHNAFTTAGFHELSWNAAGMASGIYFIRMASGQSQQVVKAVLVR
jgi:hypothetical protein